jgi:protein TonB
MLIPKFDIYDSAWLDLVFKGRNQSYGAYDLRKHYTRNLFKAMGITAVILLSVYAITSLSSPAKIIAPVKATEPTIFVDMSKEITIERTTANKAGKSHQHNGGGPSVIAVQSSQATITRQTTPAAATPPARERAAAPVPTDLPSAQPVVAKEIIIEEPDKMPLPNGGKAGLAKFLQENLQYPDAAAKNGVSGRVWLSFIVERDGKLSDIQVTQPAGNGFDEEAVRVLKLAPVWQPGIQNGQPVRVRYTIPVSFKIVK